MKKINLILGACAIAAAALLVSCNNGAKDYVNVTTINNKYVYNVTGSVITTNKNGTTAASSVDVTKQTIKTALARVKWDDDKVDESNYNEYNVKIEGKANWTNSYTAAGATTATETKWNGDFGMQDTETRTSGWYCRIPAGYYLATLIPQINSGVNNLPTDSYNNPLSFEEYRSYDYAISQLPAPVSTLNGDPTYSTDNTYEWYDGFTRTIYYEYEANVIKPLEFVFFEFDGDYYINFDNQYVKLPEDAIDGDFGDDEITIKYSTTNNTRWWMSETQKNDTTYVGSTETAYDLTFKLVEAE